MKRAITHAFFTELKREAMNTVKVHRLDLDPQAHPGFLKFCSWEEW